jgi:dihydroorotate dehydrogenase electron transfer subunit
VPPLHRRSLPVTGVEAVGAYTLLRLRNDGADSGRPGQFFMAQADPEPAGAYLPRALSAAWASEHEIAFLIDLRGEGTEALQRAARVSLLGPLGKGFRIADGPALLVGGGIGAAVLPWLRSELAGTGGPPQTLLGFRSPAHAVCAALVDPDASVVLEPVLVTEPLARLLPFAGTVYACGPDLMLQAVAAVCAEHNVPCQVAMEAAMACGFGACHGCAVRIDGAWRRLCIEGPVLESGRILV